MSIQSWTRDLVISVIEDKRTEAAALRIGGQLVTQLVLPVITVAVGAAVEKAADRLTDLDQDGKPDIGELTDAAHASIEKILPPGINLPVIGDLGKFLGGFIPDLSGR